MSPELEIDLVREVTRIVERLGDPQGADPDLTPMELALAALPGVDARNGLDIRYREYAVRLTMSDYYSDEHAILASIRHLGIAIAPEPVALLPTARGQVSIVRYWACPGEHFCRLDETEVVLRAEAIDRVRADIRALTGAGYVHPYARGTHHWWVADRSGTLVLERWRMARHGDEEDIADFIVSVETMLQERGGA